MGGSRWNRVTGSEISFRSNSFNSWKLRNRFDRRKLISMRNRSFREIGWLANIKCVEKEGRRGHVLLDDGALPFLDPRSSRFPSPPRGKS